MSIMIHPTQWLHYRHHDHQTAMDKWHEVLHHDTFWIVIIGLLVLGVALTLVLLVGDGSHITGPYMGYYP